MNKKIVVLIMVICISSLSGCGPRATGGALLGAAGGAIIGAIAGDAGMGAAIGAGVGAGTGYISEQQERSEAAAYQQGYNRGLEQPPPPRYYPVR